MHLRMEGAPVERMLEIMAMRLMSIGGIHCVERWSARSVAIW